MNRLSNLFKKRKTRKFIDSIVTLNNEHIDIIEDSEIVPEEQYDTLQKPSIQESPKPESKKVSINITLNLNIKESDADKLISILDSYF